MASDARPLWAPRAWVKGHWCDAVRLGVAADGTWSDVAVGVPCESGLTALPGPVMPGVVNAHSHAFQRAFVGMAEQRAPSTTISGAGATACTAWR